MPEVRCRVIGVWWELLALICKSAAESGAARFVVQIVCWKRKKKKHKETTLLERRKKKYLAKYSEYYPRGIRCLLHEHPKAVNPYSRRASNNTHAVALLAYISFFVVFF